MFLFLKSLLRFWYQTLSAMFVIVIGTVGYHFIEWWRWLDSLYFSIITATTIGYGDFHPVTDAGKVFTMFYVVASIGVISSFIKEITRKQHDRTQRISKSLRRD